MSRTQRLGCFRRAFAVGYNVAHTDMNADLLFVLKVGQHTPMAGRVEAPSPGTVYDVRCSSRN